MNISVISRRIFFPKKFKLCPRAVYIPRVPRKFYCVDKTALLQLAVTTSLIEARTESCDEIFVHKSENCVCLKSTIWPPNALYLKRGEEFME